MSVKTSHVNILFDLLILTISVLLTQEYRISLDLLAELIGMYSLVSERVGHTSGSNETKS